jgi:hypothetical protein
VGKSEHGNRNLLPPMLPLGNVGLYDNGRRLDECRVPWEQAFQFNLENSEILGGDDVSCIE